MREKNKKPRINVKVTQMVKSNNQHNQKKGIKQGEKEAGRKTRKLKTSKNAPEYEVLPI